MSKFDSVARLFRVGLSDPEEKSLYNSQRIEHNRKISQINADARRKAKLDRCFLCNKPCSSFCNSHSIPQFALYQIAENGKVCMSLQEEIPILNSTTGVKKAGTFHIICNDCDSKSFQDYENPKAYTSAPTDQMLAQIALKNYLQLISKRLEEHELYGIIKCKFPHNKAFSEQQQSIGRFDLREFSNGIEYAKKALGAKTGNRYQILFYRLLNYTVPFAIQSAIALISDLNDNAVNNLYNFNEDYIIEYLHVAVFPLENSSAVILFSETTSKKYRDFSKQLKKLTLNDQLAVINYLSFAYCENIFLPPTLYHRLQADEKFMDICRITGGFSPDILFLRKTPLSIAIREYSLSHRHEIPSLLSRKYALNI